MAQRKRSGTFGRAGKSIIYELGLGPLEVLGICADQVVSKMQSIVTEDEGDLRRSIKAESKEGGTIYEISANAQNEKGIAYGQFVEFDPKFSKTGPKPFMYPTMRQEKPRIRKQINKAINEAIKKGADKA